MKFKVKDHVSWNSEAGRVSGHITKIHTKQFKVNGYIKHASEENPVYEIKSDISSHVAYHFAKALRKIK